MGGSTVLWLALVIDHFDGWPRMLWFSDDCSSMLRQALPLQGARQVREAGLSALFVFVAPPSDQELEKRLRGRGTETEEQIKQRMANAKAEISR